MTPQKKSPRSLRGFRERLALEAAQVLMSGCESRRNNCPSIYPFRQVSPVRDDFGASIRIQLKFQAMSAPDNLAPSEGDKSCEASSAGEQAQIVKAAYDAEAQHGPGSIPGASHQTSLSA